MHESVIESNIQIMASALSNNAEKEIVDVYVAAGFEQEEIFLLLAAAKILYEDRKVVVKPKGVFKRVE
jgi:hypothetical protein